jgi:quercetin dioxygenase-like cupin family protein
MCRIVAMRFDSAGRFQEEVDMRLRSMGLLLVNVAIGGTVLYYARRVQATPANAGFTSSTLSLGRFDEFEVFNRFVSHSTTSHEDHRRNVWLSLQKTKGSSDLYVQTNTWAPAGSTSWHSRPGHSLITVTAGTLTTYEGDDPDCKPHTYTVGMGFIDPGGPHVHIVRNEGDVPAQMIAVQLIPAGQPRPDRRSRSRELPLLTG